MGRWLCPYRERFEFRNFELGNFSRCFRRESGEFGQLWRLLGGGRGGWSNQPYLGCGDMDASDPRLWTEYVFDRSLSRWLIYYGRRGGCPGASPLVREWSLASDEFDRTCRGCCTRIGERYAHHPSSAGFRAYG